MKYAVIFTVLSIFILFGCGKADSNSRAGYPNLILTEDSSRNVVLFSGEVDELLIDGSNLIISVKPKFKEALQKATSIRSGVSIYVGIEKIEIGELTLSSPVSSGMLAVTNLNTHELAESFNEQNVSFSILSDPVDLKDHAQESNQNKTSQESGGLLDAF